MTVDVLIVDDEADIRDLLSDILKDEGYNVRLAKDSISAFESIDDRLPAAVILDIWLHGSEMDGLGILETIKLKYPYLPVIMVSGHGNIETAVHAIQLGAYDYIEKPFTEDRVCMLVKRAIEQARLQHENEELREKGIVDNELIGESSAIQQLRSSVERVAPTSSRVLITGQAGVGKEVVAQKIHQLSKRSKGPFVVLNAASLSAEQVELELFGEEDTGGVGDTSKPRKVGTFEKAHGGTLFIDEVTDMPVSTQGKLLRLLQHQGFERVGGTRPIQVDVRVVSATNQNLEAAIASGAFREDLFYRLNVVPIKVCSLSERREDIPLLVNFFIKRLAKISGLPERKISDEALAIMQAYDWPGNVRQLKNIVEWLLIMCEGDNHAPITAAMLPPEITPGAMKGDNSQFDTDFMSKPLREAREIFEKQYLLSQLKRFGGNISRASSFIGMERSALHRKLKGLNVVLDEVNQ